MEVKDTLHYALQQRAYGSVTSDLLFKRARGSKYFIQCLERSATLAGHDGCVNSISWNDSGELLLSGSDDCRLNIYRPFQKKLLHSIKTGHRANIFSAKFLPCCSDKKIVSCSGDGVLQLTDVEQPEHFSKLSYNCHSGTVYEVITTPGDPNTFISCGEDGTVRMFDIRTKSNCTKRDCKDDILIECGKAVTSISLNPLAPYQVGIGCEDSTVALFDRRSLSTASASSGTNGMKGMIYRFKPDVLRDRTCRVTSLQYSGNGSELLVSYCADYVYLFDTKGQKKVYSDSSAVGQDNAVIPSNDSKKNTPMKRLRLRGDWSDTGPNARPESEGASTENTLMQRMSDLFVRWIEESFRGSVRRRRTAQPHDSSSMSTSSSTSLPSRSTNSSSSDSSGILEGSISSPPRDRETVTEEQSDETEESESNSPSVITVRERTVDDVHDTRESPMGPFRESPIDCPGESPSGSSKVASVFSNDSGLKQSNNSNNPSFNRLDSTNSSGCDLPNDSTLDSSIGCAGKSTLKTKNYASSELYAVLQSNEDVVMNSPEETGEACKEFKSEKISEKYYCKDNYADFGKKYDKIELQQASNRCPPSINVSQSDANSNNLNNQSELSTYNTDRSEPSNSSQDGFSSGLTQAKKRISNREVKNEQLSSRSGEGLSEGVRSNDDTDISTERDQSETSESLNNASISSNNRNIDSKQESGSHQEGVALPHGETSEHLSPESSMESHRQEPSQTPDNSVEISNDNDQEGVASTSGESSQETGTGSESSNNEAATRIQRMFRNYKAAKSARSISDCDYAIDDIDGVRWVPKMTRVYRGHRNARTMIKEARFWGDRYVVSGSDCGRIFLWDKDTTDIVMVLQGDRHVVNCVQPHPFDPVLASSGIDYDIKLWTPTAPQPVQIQGLEEIVSTNERMLEESRDTITVPASFMLRMLASLNHARLGRNQEEGSDTDSNESD